MNNFLPFLIVSLLCCCTKAEPIDKLPDTEKPSCEVKRPFPQSHKSTRGVKPNHTKPEDINKSVADYYNYWKSKYLKNSTYFAGAYYVQGENTGGPASDKGTSEGHGYGMIITALMAGYDQDAKLYFDGLVKMYDVTRSINNPYLMAWLITAKEDAGGRMGSATDGDMDIAYALLLAHEQWGSEGEVNYLKKALDMITKGIKPKLLHPASKRIMLGDWDSNSWSTRPSDWMAGHLKAYHHFSQEKIFVDAADTIYSLAQILVSRYAQVSGLLPDFVIGNPPQPAPPKFLETEFDGEYNWNACRIPLRFACDYCHYGEIRAKEWLEGVLDWVTKNTGGRVQGVQPGYMLNGQAIAGRNWSSMAFTAPLVAAAIVNPKYQVWLNEGWSHMSTQKSTYYPDTLNLLSMLLISGNWWSPAQQD